MIKPIKSVTKKAKWAQQSKTAVGKHSEINTGSTSDLPAVVQPKGPKNPPRRSR